MHTDLASYKAVTSFRAGHVLSTRRAEVRSNLPDAITQRLKREFVEILNKRIGALEFNDPSLLEPNIHMCYLYMDDNGKALDKRSFLGAIFDQPQPQIFDLQPELLLIDMRMIQEINILLELSGRFTLDGRRLSGTYNLLHSMICTDGKWCFANSTLHKVEPRRRGYGIF